MFWGTDIIIPTLHTFLSSEPFNLCAKNHKEWNQINKLKRKPLPPFSLCVILCCRVGAIFIRASYGTSHGQNNISAVVTGMWRQDESGIKIKANENKWCLLHLEGGINHMRTNVLCALSLSDTFSPSHKRSRSLHLFFVAFHSLPHFIWLS